MTVVTDDAVVATTRDQLVAAVAHEENLQITVTGQLRDVPTLHLSPGQSLTGTPGASIAFADGVDGVELTTDNTVRGLTLTAGPKQRAIFNDTDVATLGRLCLTWVTTTGSVQILARDSVRAGHVDVDTLDIIAADVLARTDRPVGYGVEVLQGAFTLWNLQADGAVVITADLVGLSAGRDGAPVLGSGIFVSGAGDAGGRLQVSRLETGAVYSDGRIVAGTPDRISGGVFTVYGADVTLVRNRDTVVTYGPNDMVLDNWGTVGRWIADAAITSFGPSGIGFVNFGNIEHLKVDAPIETFGEGARGYNVYTGTVGLAEFDRIITHGNGSIGIQISQPVGRLAVRRGVETYGGIGQSLVKGVVTTLSAIALSIKPGGTVREIVIEGGLTTHGSAVVPLEQYGMIERLTVTGGYSAAGGGFAAE